MVNYGIDVETYKISANDDCVDGWRRTTPATLNVSGKDNR